MDSGSRGQNGIQLLLTAEQEAQQIGNAARNGLYSCLTTGLTSRVKHTIHVFHEFQLFIHSRFLFAAKLVRLKQAKEEAEKEVAEFRAKMEADYQRKLTEVMFKI